MIEILINEFDWVSNRKRLNVILNKLMVVGWKRFGNNGTVVFFKDIPLEEAKNEIKVLGIPEVEPEEWYEELYSNHIF
jgi:hypothetical protein